MAEVRTEEKVFHTLERFALPFAQLQWYLPHQRQVGKKIYRI